MRGSLNENASIRESMDDDLAIDVTGLVKRFGDKTAVDGVDIQMPRGQVWGFLGPNGSGKTTTIRMVCGLLRPSAGQGRALGYDILKDSERIKRATGYMTQRFSFWGDLTIRENLDFVARLYRLPDRHRVVDRVLDGLGLAHRQNQLADTLSGGWKQRLALAAVTMHGPRLLLLDEPTAGVDPQARRDFWDEIHHLAGQGLTVLVSTHYMDEAERCDKIVYLAHGKLVTQGTVQEIVSASGLITFRATGRGVRQLAEDLKSHPNVAHAAYFGAALHVSGPDRDALRAALDRAWEAHPDHAVSVEEVEPSLEDVFIELMARAGDDTRAYG